MGKWYFCKKCGYSCFNNISTKIVYRLLGNGNPNICRNCNISLSELPLSIQKKYFCFSGKDIFSDTWIESRYDFINEFVSTFTEFDFELFCKEEQNLLETAKRHFEYQENQQQIYLEKINKQAQKLLDKQSCIPKCPICSSQNINKITFSNRAIKTVAFGVIGAMDDSGKTYQCNNCGSKF